jgi:hypothetical protein
MKKITLLLLFLASTVIPSTCLAISYSWTDVTGITGNSYTLDITGNTVKIDAYTSIGGPTGNPWYIDWIQFKITAQAITLGGLQSSPISGWSLATSANPVNLQKFGNSIPNDGFNLLYWTGIVGSGTNDDSGVLLNGNHYQWVLTGVNLGNQSLLIDPTLKVGYYDNLNGAGQFDTRQMSQKIPEPTTLLLLGSGLLVLWGFKRKFGK